MTLKPKSRTLLFPRLGRFSMAIFALLLIISGVRAFELFGFIFKENVKKEAIILIPTGSDYKYVEDLLVNNDILYNQKAFRWVSKKKEYRENIKPGRYKIEQGWNANQLVNLLRSGEQTPVKVTFNNVRTFNDLAGKVSKYFECDSVSLLTALLDETNPQKYGFTKETFSAMFIPNTYEFYWITSPTSFVERMQKEYEKYWNTEKIEMAAKHGLSPIEVSTLASIVQEETTQADEKQRVAGVYLNRLKRGMLLQADPTVKFAMGDFSIRRITNNMLETDSPYNTYKYNGLPPGPINFPETSSIEAVLNAETHNYLFMCAREDFSGYHNFARTLSQHNQNAARYRNALNKLKIWR